MAATKSPQKLSSGLIVTRTPDTDHRRYFGDTIGDVTLGELEVYTGTEWTTPGTWVVAGLEASNAASNGFIHKVGVDEILRCA